MATKQGLMSKLIDGPKAWTKVPSGWQTKDGKPLFHISCMTQRGHAFTEEDADLICAAKELREVANLVDGTLSFVGKIDAVLHDRLKRALRAAGVR
jgi:hypothetical protein